MPHLLCLYQQISTFNQTRTPVSFYIYDYPLLVDGGHSPSTAYKLISVCYVFVFEQSPTLRSNVLSPSWVGLVFFCFRKNREALRDILSQTSLSENILTSSVSVSSSSSHTYETFCFGGADAFENGLPLFLSYCLCASFSLLQKRRRRTICI